MKKVYVLALFVLSCRNPPNLGGAASGPTSSGAPASSVAAPMAPIAPRSPLTATFVDLKPEGAEVFLKHCDELFVSVVKGHAKRDATELAEGDLGIFRDKKVTISGDGLAVFAVRSVDACAREETLPQEVVVRAKTKPTLTWANGQMEANLDAERDVSPNVYAGRLAGYAAVGEHAHEGSWEILCAAEANGTFIVNNVTKTLHARQVVVIPPGTKHAWQPVAGAWLQAVQFYVPPGPEQRFKGLAAPGK